MKREISRLTRYFISQKVFFLTNIFDAAQPTLNANFNDKIKNILQKYITKNKLYFNISKLKSKNNFFLILENFHD